MVLARKHWGLILAATLVFFGGIQANDEPNKPGHADDKDHVMVRPDEVKWGPAPPALPAGAKAAVLAGDPTKAGPYVIRLQMPDGYKVMPHWHPVAENVTVLKGTFNMGRGDTFSMEKSESLPPGSFVSMPKTMRHYAWAKGDTIIQVHGIGPFTLTYVNPDDDPRKKK